MNKHLQPLYLNKEAKNFMDSFNITTHNVPRWQNEYCPRSKKVYISGLPANTTFDEVFWTEREIYKCTKIPFSLKLHLSVLEKFAKFGSSNVRRALLSLILKNVVLLKVFFCLALFQKLAYSWKYFYFRLIDSHISGLL